MYRDSRRLAISCSPGAGTGPNPEGAMGINPTTNRRVARVLLAATLLLILPVLAMQITDQIAWGPEDFAAAGLLLVGTGLTFVLVTRHGGSAAYRAAVGIALAAALLLVWLNLAVGLIGSEDDPANLMYAGVLAVGIVGAFVARCQPRGMARAMFATGLTQAFVALTALIFGLGSPGSGPLELMALNGCFIALFLGSGLLFRHAARGQVSPGAGR